MKLPAAPVAPEAFKVEADAIPAVKASQPPARLKSSPPRISIPATISTAQSVSVTATARKPPKAV